MNAARSCSPARRRTFPGLAWRLSALGLTLFVVMPLVGCGGDDGKHQARYAKDKAAREPHSPRDVHFGDKDKDKDHDKDKDKDKDGRFDREKASDEAPGTGGRRANGQTPDKPRAKAKAPVVWKRDASRRTFAQVYVGDRNTLELVSLHVSVSIDGPRARTLVDHVFRNPHNQQLEGTFEYPLPAGASPSYYAMFLGASRDAPPPRWKPRGNTPALPEFLAPAQLVKRIDTADWGRLQEARVVAQEKAREAYEEVTRRRVDPAVLEHAGGNTFRGRVFPIQPKGYNRVVLAYEETLPLAGSQMVHRFDLPGCKLTELRFSLQADARECKSPALEPAGAAKKVEDGRVTFTRVWENTTPKGELLFRCTPAEPRVQAASGRAGERGPCYLYARLRPDLPKVAREEPFAAHAVFLLDTSLSEHSARFDLSMRLLRAILEADPEIKSFNVLAFNAAPVWVNPRGWLPNTREGRDRVFALLDGIVLEGATDLSAALEKLADPGFPVARGTPLHCFLLSDGHLTWGETDVPILVGRFRARCPFPTRWHCYRTGLGEESAELFDALSRDGGGVHPCYGPDEVAAVAAAHRRQCLLVDRVRFQGGPEATEVLVAGRRTAVHPGGELIVAARLATPGQTTIVLEGRFQGEKVTRSFPVEVSGEGDLGPRAWGEVAVASLLALNDPNLDRIAVAYCQEFGIASRVASFLVLENADDYKRLNLEQERGRVVQGDLGQFLDDSWAALGKERPPRDAFARLLNQVDDRTKLLSGPGGAHVKDLLDSLGADDFALPAARLEGALLLARDAHGPYLARRKKDRRDVHTYLAEARRRADRGDIPGAVRVLSTIVEEHPGRGDALRLVGYRLLELDQPAHAAGLFRRVLQRRPFEAHSYRDLARALDDAGNPALAALLYEAVLAGNWHGRFGSALKVVSREEYAGLLGRAARDSKRKEGLRRHFEKRRRALAADASPADLRVTIAWNTDATDVDLWVIEPGGNKVFYGNKRGRNGSELSEDLREGYGPERYRVGEALRGEYEVIVHYFAANPNLLGGETHVSVVVTRHAGTAREQVRRHTVILRRAGEHVSVCKVKF
jgi:hypothetical protein